MRPLLYFWWSTAAVLHSSVVEKFSLGHRLAAGARCDLRLWHMSLQFHATPLAPRCWLDGRRFATSCEEFSCYETGARKFSVLKLVLVHHSLVYTGRYDMRFRSFSASGTPAGTIPRSPTWRLQVMPMVHICAWLMQPAKESHGLLGCSLYQSHRFFRLPAAARVCGHTAVTARF